MLLLFAQALEAATTLPKVRQVMSYRTWMGAGCALISVEKPMGILVSNKCPPKTCLHLLILSVSWIQNKIQNCLQGLNL